MYCLTKIMTGHSLVSPLKDKPWRWAVKLENDPDGKFIFELSGNEASQGAAFDKAQDAVIGLIRWWNARPQVGDVDSSRADTAAAISEIIDKGNKVKVPPGPTESASADFARIMREKGR